MLRLAMRCLKIPSNFINFTLDLFTDRYNSVITAFGPSTFYKSEVGIDQGETLSSLLWVIYLDPLLSVINKEASSPYVLDHNSNINNSNISQLAFMDDTTIVSSSIQGLTEILSIAQEFYQLNNTKINFNKADLICNCDPSSPSDPLPTSPTPFQFLSH